MKMLFIFCSGASFEHVRSLIDVHEVHGCTEMPQHQAADPAAKLAGRPGRPGASSVIITAAPEPKVGDLIDALEEYSRICPKEDEIRVFQVPVERVI